jgi:predicted short-subunit dehydrogenase-like oxidoreductase (DUF2520 family)
VAETGRDIGFIGIGVLARGLALALARQGYPVTGVYTRSRASAEALARRLPACRVYPAAQELADASGLVFITTPDAAIGPAASSVRWRPGQGVVHCSGALTLVVLRPAADQGAQVGGFHPFQTLAGLDSPEEAAARLHGVSFAVAGEDWLRACLTGMAAALGGRAVHIPDADRPLYHASAILACGYLATLVQAAVSLWREMGLTPQEAMEAIRPLTQATLDNLARHPGAMESMVTGPVVRGDAATVEAHLEALSRRSPGLAHLYAALTWASLPLARERGVSPQQLAQMSAAADRWARTSADGGKG